MVLAANSVWKWMQIKASLVKALAAMYCACSSPLCIFVYFFPSTHVHSNRITQKRLKLPHCSEKKKFISGAPCFFYIAILQSKQSFASLFYINVTNNLYYTTHINIYYLVHLCLTSLCPFPTTFMQSYHLYLVVKYHIHTCSMLYLLYGSQSPHV